jgi:hypothetical protein
MLSRKGAGGYATLFSADEEAVQTEDVQLNSETDTRLVDSNGNVPGLIV